MAFKPLPGDSKRRAYDPDSGEIISRRQYDQRYGRLAGTGLTYDSAAKLRKPGNILSGVSISHLKDTSFFMSPSGYSDTRREDIINHLTNTDKEMVRFIYEKNGIRQSSNWYMLGEGQTDSVIQAALTDLHYPAKGGGEDIYEADTLVGFAFL